MAFIRTVPPEEATGMLRELYDHGLKTLGYIANGTKTMSLRPEAFQAWNVLSKTVRSKMRLRRYELVTLAAAMRNFISRFDNALGTEPDEQNLELEPNVRKAMQKGQPFAEESICPLCFGTHIIRKIRTADGREEYYCPACARGGVLKPKNKYSEQQKLQILEHYERYSPQRIKETYWGEPDHAGALREGWEEKAHSLEKVAKGYCRSGRVSVHSECI
jgi:hypothetical protein